LTGKGTRKTLSEKQTIAKRAGSVAQELECFFSKCKALNSNPSTIARKRKKFFSFFGETGV
jgi:hypothetical protein